MSNDFWKGYLTATIIAMLSLIFVGNIAHCEDITSIITQEARKQGLEPRVALAIATIESSLNPNVVGPKGEIGLFQIRPQFTKVPITALFNPRINARVGIQKLLETKDRCALQENLTYVICFNNGWRKPVYPYLHPYYKRFMLAWSSL